MLDNIECNLAQTAWDLDGAIAERRLKIATRSATLAYVLPGLQLDPPRCRRENLKSVLGGGLRRRQGTRCHKGLLALTGCPPVPRLQMRRGLGAAGGRDEIGHARRSN
jgi:hypothetical protein